MGASGGMFCGFEERITTERTINTSKRHLIYRWLALLLASFVLGSPIVSLAQTRTLRIAAYNLEADITLTNVQPTFTNVVQTPGPPLPGLIAPPTNSAAVASGGVLEGIGEEVVNGDAQPVDIFALEETTGNPITVTPIVNALNMFYGVAGMYSNSPYQGTESGNFAASGNGPNAMVYNTRMVRLLASVPVDPLGGTGNLGSASGEYREVMRYLFAPAGVATNAANTFYIYVSHYKASSGPVNDGHRNAEAQIVRSNAATLSVSARILHVGDFNSSDSTNAMYLTLIAPGTNQFLDPINPSGSIGINWEGSGSVPAKTWAATGLHYRDDYHVMTTNVYYGTSNGLTLVSGTYHAFGNNGSVGYLSSVNSGGNTALNNRLVTNGPVFISAAQLYVDLTGASDHLPIVADYTIAMPVPRITALSIVAGTNLTFTATNGITNAVYSVLMSTNITSPLTNWTTIASYTAPAGAFTFTATNAVNPTGPQRFFMLRGK